jgi:site-specific DNA-cytosine methylase
VIESTIVPAIRDLEFRSPVRAMKEKPLKFLEFFAGIGLTHLGLAPHGWKCVYANDIEPKKKRMYESQFGTADYYHVEDVWNTKRITSRILDKTNRSSNRIFSLR